MEVGHLAGHESGVLMNGIITLIRKDLREMISVSLHKRIQLKDIYAQTRKSVLI